MKIQKKETFKVAGISKESINPSLCPKLWDKLYSTYTHEQFTTLGEGESVGVCYDFENPKSINYLAGYIITDELRAEEMGLDILEIPEAEYAVVELIGKVPDCLRSGRKYALEELLPKHGYVHSGAPDFEYYCDGDLSSEDYIMELWIPIIKE